MVCFSGDSVGKVRFAKLNLNYSNVTMEDQELEWPEEISRTSPTFWRQILRNWTYGYMNAVLSKGKLQREGQSTSHLKLADLYRIPSDLESSDLLRNYHRYVVTKRNKGFSDANALLPLLFLSS